MLYIHSSMLNPQPDSLLYQSNLINIHLFDRRTSILILSLHLFILLLLWLFRLGCWDLGSLGLGPVHDGCTCVDYIFTSFVHLGRGDDGVDVLGLLGLSGEFVVEPLLGSCALFNLSHQSPYHQRELKILTTFSLSADSM